MTLRIPVIALRDSEREPRESLTLVGELRAYDSANQEQIVEGKKNLFIIDQP